MKLTTLLRRPSSAVALAVFIVVAGIWTFTAVRAAQPETLDQRTYDVASQLQCPVCNGESVADASTQVAVEMRDVIRHKLSQGESEQQVLQYFHDSYGDAILESPPKQGFTMIIWIGPFVALLAGLFVLRSVALHWKAVAPGAATLATSGGEVALDGDDMRRYRVLLRRELQADDDVFSLGVPEEDD